MNEIIDLDIASAQGIKLLSNDLSRNKTCCNKDYLFLNSTFWMLSSQNDYTIRTNTSLAVTNKVLRHCMRMKSVLRLCTGKGNRLCLNTNIVTILYLLHMHLNIIIWLWNVSSLYFRLSFWLLAPRLETEKCRKSTGLKGRWFHSCFLLCGCPLWPRRNFLWSSLHSLKLYYLISLI